MAKNCFIGIDIGGTKTAIAKIKADGTIISLKKIATPTESDFGFLVDLVKKIGTEGMKGIGIGIAGLVDFERQTFVGGPNLPTNWGGQSPATLLRRAFRVPTAMDNDAHCFALGEARYGLARKHRNALGVTVGTGIGGGLILNSKVYRGRNNAAGEVGHTIIDCRSAATCSCGQKGHLEALAAGQALVKRYRQISGKTQTAELISTAAKKGNRAARKAIAQTAQCLGLGLASVASTVNPDIIVIGGGLAKTFGLVNAAKQTFRQHTAAFQRIQDTSIVKSQLGPRANLLGAAALIMGSHG